MYREVPMEVHVDKGEGVLSNGRQYVCVGKDDMYKFWSLWSSEVMQKNITIEVTKN